MKKMKIEVLEETGIKGKDRVTGRLHILEFGDRATVSHECGSAWCAHGWVKDLSGEVPTGERVVRGRRLSVDNVNLASTAKKV